MRNHAVPKQLRWNALIIWECEAKEILRSKIIPGLPALPIRTYAIEEGTDLAAAEEG